MQTVTRINRNTANRRRKAYNEGMASAILDGGTVPPYKPNHRNAETREAFHAGWYFGRILRGGK